MGVIWALCTATPPACEVTVEGKDEPKFDLTMAENELVSVLARREIAMTND